MALNTSRVTSIANPGVTAAATARPASGGRNVASQSASPLEESGFSPQIGNHENRLLRYDEEMRFDFSDNPEPEKRGTPFVMRADAGFKAETVDQATQPSRAGVFLDMLARGVSTYERTMRVTMPGAVRPGSVMNYLY